MNRRQGGAVQTSPVHPGPGWAGPPASTENTDPAGATGHCLTGLPSPEAEAGAGEQRELFPKGLAE